MDLAGYIDYTDLRPQTGRADIEKLCETAVRRGYASVCVNSRYAALCAGLLKGSGVKTVCTVGFPLGASSAEAKAFEAETAVGDGADEIDMVLSVGAVKDGDAQYLLHEIREVKKCGVPVKVIIEACLLTENEIAFASALCAEAEADFVKTSTGFSSGGATEKAVEIIKANCGACKIKAAGGIRDKAAAERYISLGVSRIGTSSEL